MFHNIWKSRIKDYFDLYFWEAPWPIEHFFVFLIFVASVSLLLIGALVVFQLTHLYMLKVIFYRKYFKTSNELTKPSEWST